MSKLILKGYTVSVSVETETSGFFFLTKIKLIQQTD